MSEQNDAPIQELTDEECWEKLRTTPLGRIALVLGGDVEVFPVNYITDGTNIFVRTSEGTKLLGIVVRDVVAFEIDDYNQTEGWSVIVKAHGEMLQRNADIEYAQSLDIHPWVPTRKKAFIRLEPRSVSGRRFIFGPTPEDYWQ